MRLVFAGLLSVGLAASVFADPRDFAVNVKPIFESTFSWPNAPVAVEIENKGPDAVGQILATSEEQSTRYPIELPTGAKKRVITYPSNSAYGMAPELFLDTNQGRFQIPFTAKGSYAYGNTSLIALISDNAGELSFIRAADNTPNNQQSMYGDAYCVPEDAPDRPVGYQGLSAIVLGEGCDRISDSAVRAIQSYATTGGTVIFVGGASARVLSDPRWAGFLPGSDFKTANIAKSKVLAAIGKQDVPDSMTVAAGRAESFAKVQRDGQVPIILERGYGLGRVVVFAFNPFEDPVSRWSGRKRLFAQFARSVDYQRASQFLTQFDATSTYNPYDYSYGGATAGGPGGSYYQSDRSDPFSVELPGVSKVFWILAAFFVSVVPINFFVLRKLGKGEWAWVTAPVISLTFAGIFLNQASDLYSASLSTATKGALVVQQGGPEGIFVGSTQIFFPNGGTYDLKMENVDQLGSGSPNEYYGRRPQTRTQVNPVDTGVIRIPDLRAANLAFEEIGYRQRFTKFPGVQIQTHMIGNSLVRLKIRNSTGSDLRNAALIVAGRRYGVDLLQSGGEKTMEVTSIPSPQDQQADFLEGLTVRQPVAVLVADINGLKAGPQIGNMVAGRSSTRLIHVAPIGSGERL